MMNLNPSLALPRPGHPGETPRPIWPPRPLK